MEIKLGGGIGMTDVSSLVEIGPNFLAMIYVFAVALVLSSIASAWGRRGQRCCCCQCNIALNQSKTASVVKEEERRN